MRRMSPRFVVDVSTCYDIIYRYRHRIALSGVSVTWCVSVYNEDYLVWESRYPRFWWLQHDFFFNKYACDEFSLYLLRAMVDCGYKKTPLIEYHLNQEKIFCMRGYSIERLCITGIT